MSYTENTKVKQVLCKIYKTISDHGDNAVSAIYDNLTSYDIRYEPSYVSSSDWKTLKEIDSHEIYEELLSAYFDGAVSYQNEEVKNLLFEVNEVMAGMGYKPVNRIASYLAEEDPSYITSRYIDKITNCGHYMIVKELISAYVK